MTATSTAKMTIEEKEAFHRKAEARITTFRYTPPEQSKWTKDVIPLAKTPLLKVFMQVVREGGENNLHYHTASDTTWMVHKGRGRFYGVGDVVLAELGPNEGITIPGGSRYWFEKTGPEDLEILQMVGFERGDKDGEDRIDIAENKNRARLERNRGASSD